MAAWGRVWAAVASCWWWTCTAVWPHLFTCLEDVSKRFHRLKWLLGAVCSLVGLIRLECVGPSERVSAFTTRSQRVPSIILLKHSTLIEMLARLHTGSTHSWRKQRNAGTLRGLRQFGWPSPTLTCTLPSCCATSRSPTLIRLLDRRLPAHVCTSQRLFSMQRVTSTRSLTGNAQRSRVWASGPRLSALMDCCGSDPKCSGSDLINMRWDCFSDNMENSGQQWFHLQAGILNLPLEVTQGSTQVNKSGPNRSSYTLWCNPQHWTSPQTF